MTPDEGVISDVERTRVRRQEKIISVWRWSPRVSIPHFTYKYTCVYCTYRDYFRQTE